jgi:type III pantothenate kinase
MKQSLVIDAGNTRIKVALFEADKLVSLQIFSENDLSDLKKYLHDFKSTPAIISSVRSEKNTKWLYSLLPYAHRFNQTSPLPIQINYDTPLTLGLDRIANAIAVAENSTALVIDLGTCLKFDFIKDQAFIGGSISPGLRMRFKALNEFTGNLPLIHDFEKIDVIATNTTNALISGVVNGMEKEILGFIEDYKRKYPKLTIFMTGGDALHFDFAGKYGIFVDENLTLKGLNKALFYVQTHLSNSF